MLLINAADVVGLGRRGGGAIDQEQPERWWNEFVLDRFAEPVVAVLAGVARRGVEEGTRWPGVSPHGLRSVDGLADDVGVSGVLGRLGHDVHQHPAG
jgi:hypothetical protein